MKILCGSTSGPSARLVRDELVKLHGRHIFVTHYPNTLLGQDFIRYGNGQEVQAGYGRDLLLNTRELICVAGNKGAFSRRVKDIVYTPIFSYGGEPTEFPVVIRSTLHGYAGRGITVVADLAAFRAALLRGYTWAPFVKTAFEVRAHVMGGEIKRLFKKIAREGEVEDEYPIRRNANYDFSLRNDISKYPKLVAAVQRLCSLDIFQRAFFAVDAGWDAAKEEWFIFEINSAPGVSEHTAAVYAQYIWDTINRR